MKRFLSTLTFAAAFCGVASADDIPLRNWAVPPQASGGLSTLADVGAPAIFVGMAPCRVADTRGNGYTGAYGPPLLAAGVPRTFNLVASTCTGIPSGVSAFSLNFTVVGPTGAGILLAWPAGGVQPSISVLNYVTGQTVANAAIVPAGSGTSISVVAGVHSTNLLIDINGYFIGGGGTMNTGGQLAVSTYVDGAAAIVGYNYSNVDGSHGVGGYEGGTGKVYGVQGQISASAATGSSGVHGIGAATTAKTYAVMGETSASGVNSAAVFGDATAVTSNNTYGVWGQTESVSFDSAGVEGLSANASASGGLFWNPGLASNPVNTYIATTGSPGAPAPGGANYGIWVTGGNIYATAGIYGTTKNFVAPHPTDPSKEIVYTSVEAPSADIYFRGTAHLVNGAATIEVPEHFRVSARPDSYQTNLTVVGPRGFVSVESEGPQGIVIRGTVETVHYMVYAERDVIERQLPVRDNVHFDARALARGGVRTLPEGYQELLVKNGTLNPDLTLNKRTAERLGWVIPAGVEAK